MTDTADTRRRTENAAFDAQLQVWNSLFHLSMAHKFGGRDSLREARFHLFAAIDVIDAAQPAPVQEAAE